MSANLVKKMEEFPESVFRGVIMDSATEFMATSCTRVTELAKKAWSAFQRPSTKAQFGRTLLGALAASCIFQYRVQTSELYKTVRIYQLSNVGALLALIHFIWMITFCWNFANISLGYMSHTLSLMKDKLVHHFVIDIFLGLCCGYAANTLWIRMLASGASSGDKPDSNYPEFYSILDFLQSPAPFLLLVIIALSIWLKRCYPNPIEVPEEICHAQKISDVKSS